jgi:hypothetical protein
LAKKDPKLSGDKRKALAQTYAGQALAALHRALDFGYKDGDQLVKDPDFNSIRELDDFKRVVAELSTKK